MLNTEYCLYSSFLESKYLFWIKEVSCSCHIAFNGELPYNVSNTVTPFCDTFLDFNC